MRTTKTKSAKASISRKAETPIRSSAVSDSGLYSAADIQRLEYPGMFHSPLQRVIFDGLVDRLYREKTKISAGSNVEALNMLKEAAVVLSSRGFRDDLYSSWLSSCYDAFTSHFRPLLVSGNRT